MHFIDYESLASRPDEVLHGIMSFLKIERSALSSMSLRQRGHELARRSSGSGWQPPELMQAGYVAEFPADARHHPHHHHHHHHHNNLNITTITILANIVKLVIML